MIAWAKATINGIIESVKVEMFHKTNQS